MPLFYFIIFLSLPLLIACQDLKNETSTPSLEIQAYALNAYCEANVNGVGILDVENEYLPRVVNCENGGAPLEALKAQAVAARTYLYYKLETSGSINDGQSDQVYGCSRSPSDIHFQAVRETAGQVLRYHNKVIASFYVAGAIPQAPSCVATAQDSDPTGTESYVTYNEGNRGDAVEQSTLGWVNANNFRNRGCQSQNGAKCLANVGKSYEEILNFYYGDDIELYQATGECIDAPVIPMIDQGVDMPFVDQSILPQMDAQFHDFSTQQQVQDMHLEEDHPIDQALISMPNTPTMIDPITQACILDRRFEMLRHDISCGFHECQTELSWQQDGEGNLKVASDLLAPSCFGGWKIKLTATGTYELRVWTPAWFAQSLEVNYVVMGGRYASSLKIRLEPETWSMIGKFGFMAGDQIEITLYNRNTVNTEIPLSMLMVREEGLIQQQEQAGQDPTLLNPFGQKIEHSSSAPIAVSSGCQQKQSNSLCLCILLFILSFSLFLKKFNYL